MRREPAQCGEAVCRSVLPKILLYCGAKVVLFCEISKREQRRLIVARASHKAVLCATMS